MKKTFPVMALAMLLAMACTKQLVTGGQGCGPGPALAAVTAASVCMLVSSASFSTGDSLGITFNAQAADSICWAVVGDSTIPVPTPPGAGATGPGDTGMMVSPPTIIDGGWLPIDTTIIPPPLIL